MMTNFDITTLIREDLTVTGLDANNFEDAIATITDTLIEKNVVKDGFAEQVIEREAQYPTALPTNIIKVAIPHPIDTNNVVTPAITIAKLKTPIEMNEMGSLENKVDVGLLVVLSVKGDSSQMDILTTLIGLFSDETFLQKVEDSENNKDLYNLFLENMI